MKHKDVFITLMVVIPSMILVGLVCFGIPFIVQKLDERDRAEYLAFYKRDDCCITITATLTRAEHIDASNAYLLYLQYDEQISDFRFAEYFLLLSINVDELQKNGFDFTQLDKQYVFTIGRHTISYDSTTLPIVAIREVEEGGKVYLDYETGMSNLISYIKKH